MKPVTHDKAAKDNRQTTEPKPESKRPKAEAQCCAKASRTAVGCHD